MFNNTQPQAMPYLTRLNGYQQDKEKAANNSLLPINQPGGNTDTQLPVAKEKEDPMKDIEQSSFYQNHQRFMQNDKTYADQFNQFASTAAALHKEVQNGTMPQPIAEKRLQEAVLEAQKTAATNAQQVQRQQAMAARQQQKQPQGALATPINQMQMGAGDVPTSSAQDAAAMAAAQQGQQPQQAAPQPNPQEQAQMQQQAQDQQSQAVNTQQTQANTLSKGSIEDLAKTMREGLAQEGDDAKTIASMYYNTKGYTNEDVDKAAAMAFGDQHSAQASETPKGVAPQFAVSDGQINATAARNANISQGIGDYKGNVEAPEQPTPSQQLNQSLDQSANEVTAQVNEIPNWYESKAFGYSLMRFGLGLLGGEDMVGALKGASMSYMDLDGMEKRERWRGDLQKEGYNNAQIEAYIQTGNSNLLKKDKPIKDTWVNLGQGMKMNQATGEVEKVEGWEKQQNLRYFQEGNSGEYIGYDPNTGQQVRTGVVGRLPTTGQNAPKFQWVGDDSDPTKERLKQYDASTGGWLDTGEMRTKGSGQKTATELRLNAINNAENDVWIGKDGPGTLTPDQQKQIGQFGEVYQDSTRYLSDIARGVLKPAELNTLTSNVIQSIVQNPDDWLSGALLSKFTEDEQRSLTALKKIIDPIARARSGAAIGIKEMADYLSYLKDIHREGEYGKRARIGLVTSMASMVKGKRKDFDFLENVVMPTATDARPGQDGLWHIRYRDPESGQMKDYAFKRGRFFQ